MLRNTLLCLALAAILTGCASAPPLTPETGVPVTQPAVQPAPPPAPAVPVRSLPVKPAAPAASSTVTSPAAARAMIDRLLPPGIPARRAWNDSILTAFTQLKIPYSTQYFCAVMAVAEQESSFDPDPVVPNLSAIVWKQIEEHRKKYMIPSFVVDAALLKRSPDGRSYKERINALRTKRQMNQLYGEMIRELPYGQDMLANKNPIRDGGPMQVSVAFAETQVRAWPYPYSYTTLRDEVFSLRGSVYFGTAILLQYAAPYQDMVYRFADYNAGRYSSRNAAFQAAVARLSGRRLSRDGDLMLYSNKMNRVLSGAVSETQRALNGMSATLQMSPGEMLRDLRQEKLASFSQTPLYQRVFSLADRQAGGRVPREMIPQIVLISPKITSHLTTEWFARKVDGRYRRCLVRGGLTGN